MNEKVRRRYLEVKTYREIVALLLIVGTVLVFAGLVFVGFFFQTSDGRTCQLTLWQIRCFQFVRPAPSDTTSLILEAISPIILPLGILLIVVPLAALLWTRHKEH